MFLYKQACRCKRILCLLPCTTLNKFWKGLIIIIIDLTCQNYAVGNEGHRNGGLWISLDPRGFFNVLPKRNTKVFLHSATIRMRPLWPGVEPRANSCRMPQPLDHRYFVKSGRHRTYEYFMKKECLEKISLNASSRTSRPLTRSRAWCNFAVVLVSQQPEYQSLAH